VARRIGFYSMAVIAVAALAACSSGRTAQPPLSTPATTTPPTTSATSIPTPAPTTTPSPTTAVPPTITGYGATLSDWKATHTRDSDYESLPAYGPTIQTPGGPTPQFIEVQDDGQRIIQFIESLPEETSLADAQKDTLAQLPTDTVPGPFDVSNQNGSCAFWNLTSPALAAVGAGGGGIGAVVVEMAYDDSNGEPTYRPSDINTITIEIGRNDSTGTC
jgi:hypothetical protein